MTPLTCEQAVKRFFGYLDRALQGEEIRDLEAHLEQCLACCDKLAFSKQLDEYVERRLPDEPVPEDLEARVRRALARAGGGA